MGVLHRRATSDERRATITVAGRRSPLAVRPPAAPNLGVSECRIRSRTGDRQPATGGSWLGILYSKGPILVPK